MLTNEIDFLVVMISPVMINNIGYKTYIVWAVTNLCFIPMIYFLSKCLVTIPSRAAFLSGLRQVLMSYYSS